MFVLTLARKIIWATCPEIVVVVVAVGPRRVGLERNKVTSRSCFFAHFLSMGRFFSHQVPLGASETLLFDDRGHKWLSVYRFNRRNSTRITTTAKRCCGLFSCDCGDIFPSFIFVCCAVFVFFYSSATLRSVSGSLTLVLPSASCFILSSWHCFRFFFLLQVAFVQTPQRFRKDLPDDPLGNHAASQVSDDGVSAEGRFLLFHERGLVRG